MLLFNSRVLLFFDILYGFALGFGFVGSYNYDAYTPGANEFLGYVRYRAFLCMASEPVEEPLIWSHCGYLPWVALSTWWGLLPEYELPWVPLFQSFIPLVFIFHSSVAGAFHSFWLNRQPRSDAAGLTLCVGLVAPAEANKCGPFLVWTGVRGGCSGPAELTTPWRKLALVCLKFSAILLITLSLLSLLSA